MGEQKGPTLIDTNGSLKVRIETRRRTTTRNNHNQQQQRQRDDNAMKKKQKPLDASDLLIETRLSGRFGITSYKPTSEY
jgi:hypothetical protein